MRIDRFGDEALVLAPPLEGSAVERAQRLAAVAAAVRRAAPAADIVQGGTTILVVGGDEHAVRAALAAPVVAARRAPAHHRISVVYDGHDLESVARTARLSSDEVVRAHTARTYTAIAIGFLPGFAYLGEVDPRIATPRLASPRKRVPAASVGIAGAMTGIYPFASPGGWNLIGRAVEPRLFDPDRDPPRRIALLDTVELEAISPEAARAIAPAPRPLVDVAPGSGALRVDRCAPVCTVQDRGRPGRRGDGVPLSGALDPHVLARANLAVGNAPAAAAIEIPLGGFSATALDAVVVSVDGEPARSLAAGDRVDVAPVGRAVRYLALRGGVEVPSVLGSRSTLLVAGIGGLAGRTLHAGDRLRAGTDPGGEVPSRPPGSPPDPKAVADLGVIPAPPDDRLGDLALEVLARDEYRVSAASDRVGARLEGPALPRRAADRGLPEPVLPGAIQVTTDGGLVVLGPDCPTTGGYPVIGLLPAEDRALFFRLRPGHPVRFLLR